MEFYSFFFFFFFFLIGIFGVVHYLLPQWLNGLFDIFFGWIFLVKMT